MADRAQISSGAIAGSALIQVSAPDRQDGTDVLVYVGPVRLGKSDLAAGACSVILDRPLVAGEVVQASLVSPGDGCGLPIVVSEPGVVVGGWRTPTELEVTTPDGQTITMPVDQFKEQYGYIPASIQDPAGLRANVYPEYLPEQIRQIQFSVQIRETPGQTFVSIQNVTGTIGMPIVQWATNETFGSDMARSFTSSRTITLAVKGTGDATPATRTLDINVPSSAGSSAGDIVSLAYRFQNGPFIRALLNSTKQTEVRLLNFADWQESSNEEAQYQECFFQNVPSGTYTIQARVKGDSNSANWRQLTVTKPF